MSDDLAERVRTRGGNALRVEENGINVIAESERKGQPRELFWPWFGANVSVLGLSYGSFVLGFGISFLQAVIVGLIGIVFSFWLCGVIATAGKRGSAPTMVLSRARLRGAGQSAALGYLVAALRRLGDGPHGDRRTGDLDGLHAHWLERRQRYEGRRHARHRRTHYRRRGHGLRPHHAHASSHHGRHRRLDDRLHCPHVQAHQLARRVPSPQWQLSVDRRARWSS